MGTDKVKIDIVADTKKAIGDMAKYAAGVGAAVLIVNKMVKTLKEMEQAFFVQEQAEAKLSAALTATGNAVGITSDEMFRMASEMSKMTTFADEAIIAAEGLLVTFTQIGKETFPEALEAAADMSTMFGQDLQQSVIQLGTALNDPIAGVGRLKRIGISFTETQRESIKTYVEQNDIMSAQKVILDELRVEFGGVSREMGDTAYGAAKKLENATTDLKETFGGLIANALQPAREALTEIITGFNDLLQANINVKEVFGEAKDLDDIVAVYDQLQERLQAIQELQKAYQALIDKEPRGIAETLVKLRNKLEYQRNLKKATETELELLNAIAVIEEKVLEIKGKRSEEEAKITAEQAKQEAMRRQHLEDVAVLEEAYAKTPEGIREALEAQIAFFETYKDGPMASAVLKDLREQLEKMDSVTEDTRVNFQAMLTDMDLLAGGGLVRMSEQTIAAAQNIKIAKTETEEWLNALNEGLAMIGVDAFLGTMEGIGAAFKASAEGAEDFATAMKSVGQAILDALPGLLVQVALKAAEAGQWEIAAAAIAGAGVAALVKGAVNAGGETSEIPKMAAGGIVTSPTLAVIGEAGPEAVVPLNNSRGIGNTIIINQNVAGSVVTENQLARMVAGQLANMTKGW